MNFTYKSITLLGIFLSLAMSVAVNDGKQGTPPKLISQTSEPIRLHVTVTNERQFVTELKQDNFQVSMDNIPARIVHFGNEDLPISMGILVDASHSMGSLGTKKDSGNLSIVEQSLAKFFELSNPANEYFLVGFNEKPQLLADWTSDGAVILDKLVGLKPSGNTALFDACYVGLDKLQYGRHLKRVLLLITDGRDNTSRYSFANLRELLRETGALLYSIYLPSKEDVGSLLTVEVEGILSELTATSGGRSSKARLSLKQRDFDKILEMIARELRKQYSILIEPPNSPKNKEWHKIRLKLNLPAGTRSELKKLSTRTRQGVYSWQN